MPDKLYDLPDGGQLIVTEERCLFVRAKSGSIPISTDADDVLDDVLSLVDKKDAVISILESESRRYAQVGAEAIEERDRLRHALEESLDRICNGQPNAAGFILAEALKETKEEQKW